MTTFLAVIGAAFLAGWFINRLVLSARHVATLRRLRAEREHLAGALEIAEAHAAQIRARRADNALLAQIEREAAQPGWRP